MYLKRLEVFGFKSFAEKTVLNFEQGIAAIVGPNGCGKSNVFDAIRWVLGEQSAKDLRGSSMEDVIFNGTDKKAPLGFAEVSLTFANQTRILPVDHDEVIITRRLFRSGESEYLINKNTSRLRDIVELFLGTGVGAEAYSLIQQGRVDMVVSAKPEDRRQIFDEAAGITKYKAKKKEALSKLKDAEDNLLRINDIVVEVKRQIATIERQAKKAQRYKEDFEQLKQYELVMAQHQMGQFSVEQEAIKASLSALQAREQEALAQLDELSHRMGHETALLEQAEEQLNVLRGQQNRLDNEIELNARQIMFNEERLNSFDEALLRLDEDKRLALERCTAAQLKVEELRKVLAQLQEDAALAQGRLQEKRSSLSLLLASTQEAQETIKSFEQEIFSFHAQENRVKNQLTDNMKRGMEAQARQSRLEHENNKVSNEQQQIAQKFNGISAAIGQVQGLLESLWVNCNARRSELEGLKSSLGLQEQAIDDLEKSKVFLSSQKEFIQKMHLQYQENPDPVVEGKFIAAIRPNEQQTGIIGRVKHIDVIAATETSPECYEITYETKYIALDLQHMDERVVNLDAQLALSIEAKGALNESIRQLESAVEADLKAIQDQEKKLSVLESQKNDVEMESGKLVGELDMITNEFAEIQSTLASLKVQEGELSAVLSSIHEGINRAQEDIKVKRSAIAQKNQEREELNVAIAQMDAEYAAVADKQHGLQENLNVYTAGLDRDLADITRFDQEVQEYKAKKAKTAEDNAQLAITIEQSKAQLESIRQECNQCAQEKNEMALALNSLRHQSRAIEEEIITAKTELHNLEMKNQELQFSLRTLKERLLQTYKIDWDALVNQPPVLPVAAANVVAEGATEAIAEVVMGEDGQPIAIEAQPVAAEAQATAAGLPMLPPQVNFEELAIEIDRLKKRCESYGAVNLVAIEEFEELKGRYEFLTKQQSDLLTAREQLMSTIQKINKTTRQMFTDTFTKVNEEFQTFFRMLFSGGEAQLILLDPENALECGIDIVARPPGKKPQSISLLSGGEKTMTAIALIFAVFKVNPSPFCVLDEIDAALDEANVGRFAKLLKEFAKIAQFVVITHNKKTMAVADVMYGVTMQERGVSRIVSVKFNEYQPQPQAIPPQSQPALASVWAQLPNKIKIS